MKRNHWLKGLLLGAIGFTTLGIAACGDDKSQDTFTGFLPGVAVEMQRRETLFLDEFIAYPTDGATYTITMQYKGGEPQDLTDKSFIELFEAGEYTLTYTIHSGKNTGTYVHTLFVPYDTVQWSYTAQPIDIQYQTELSFDTLLDELNIAVISHTEEEWSFYVKSIRIGDDVINVDANATSYYIDRLEPHHITYGITTIDGQKGQSIITANVYFSDTVSDLYLNSLNSTGTYEIAVNGATEVKVNDETCNDVTIESDKIVFQKQDLYEKYSGTNFVSIATANGEVRDTINVYTESVSFEEDNSMAPAFLKHYGENMVEEGTFRMIDRFATDGDMALELMCSEFYWPWYTIDMEYLDVMFSDPQVNAFSFDLTYAGKTEEMAYREFAVWEYGKTGLLNRNVPRTITMMRAHYEKLKADIAAVKADPENQSKYSLYLQIAAKYNVWVMQLQNARDAVGGTDSHPKLYFDNFRAVSLLETQTYKANDTADGDLVIDVEGITNITMNGEAIPEDKVQITGSHAVIDKDWMHAHIGRNLLTIKAERKTYELTVNIYPIENDFEDGANPGFITASVGSISVADYNGSKALQFVVGEGQALWPQFIISNEYLKLAFKNANELTTLSWDLTVNFTPRAVQQNNNTLATNIVLTSSNTSVISNVTLANGGKKTFTIGKAQYEALAGADLIFTWMNQWENTGCGAITWYIDDIRIGVGEKLVLPNFDNGSPNVSGYTTLGNGSAIQCYYGSTNSEGTQKAGYSGLTTDQRILFQTAGGLVGSSLAFNFFWKVDDNASPWKFGFAIAWLDAVFADANITAMQFSINLPNNVGATGITTDVAQSWTDDLVLGAWSTLTMTRDDYNAIKDATTLEVDGFLTITITKSGETYTSAFWCLLDEFKGSTEPITPSVRPAVDETALTLDFNNLPLGVADGNRYYLSDATTTDIVSVNTFGYNEHNGADASADEKALKFYMSHSTQRRYMYVNIVLTDAMKDAITEGATLSFAYALNRCLNSGYTHYNVSVGATDGSTTQQLVTQKGPGWDNTNGTWGPNPLTYGKADAKQWETLTITDATVLSELATTGILQITIEAVGWNQYHETNFWIDNITVVNE